jgi:site-specific recombinase XerD
LSRKVSSLSNAAHYQFERYLRYLQSRNYADGTLLVVISCLRRFLKHQPTSRCRQLSADLFLTTAADVEQFVSSAGRSELAPATINNTLSNLAVMFDFFVEEEKMRQSPVRGRHRVFAPQHLPKPMAEADVKRFFRVIDKVLNRLMFLPMLRANCAWRRSLL